MTWSEVIGTLDPGNENYGWLTKLLNSIEWVMWIALILVGACGAVYAIYVGVKMARADSSEQREEAKKRLINIIVSIVVTIALILFFNVVLPLILDGLDVFESYKTNGKDPALKGIIDTTRALIGM